VKTHRIASGLNPAGRTARALRILSGLLLGVAVACVLQAWRVERAFATSNDTTASAQRTAYSQSVSEHYNFRFGAGKPFLPSNAETDTGEFIDPKSFPTAKYCGHCHQEAYAEWRQTAHANSFRAPWYVKNVNLLMNGKGIEFARH